LTAVIGIFAVSPRAGDRSHMTAINRGFFISAAVSVVLVAVLAFTELPSKFSKLKGLTNTDIASHAGNPRVFALIAVIIGIVLAAVIQQLTGY
jgi:K(+)-stimulated pyrophosphate-energized sodium pump